MNTLAVILLAIIAWILWGIYRQKEVEKEQIASKEFEAKWEQEQKEKYKDYPHLIGKLEGNWLQVFAHQVEGGIPLLKMSFFLMLHPSARIDLSEGSRKWDSLWSCTEELLEHLEKYHEGTVVEHEIAVATYWQIAAEAVDGLIKENPEIEGKKLEVKPYTNIEKIVSLFPKKAKHPVKEITFFDDKGSFPRESKGSTQIHEKLKSQGA